MANLLETGSNWLEAQRHAQLTTPVVYTRGAVSIPLNASIGKSIFNLDTGVGPAIQIESRDFLVRRGDLVADGLAFLPQRGDRIAETDASGATYVFEVIGPGDAPCWRWADAFRKTVRVHTKQVQP